MTVDGTTHRARAAVPRPRNAEPDRVRRHLSAARGAARPIPAQDRRSAIRARTTSGRCSPGGSRAASTRSSSRRWSTRSTLLDMQAAIEDVHVGPDVGRYAVALVRGTRESASVAVGSSPRGSLALLKLSRCRAALGRARLRHTGRRQGGRHAGARPPARAQAGAVGAAANGCGRRAGGARLGPHAAGRRTGRTVTPHATPRLTGYAALVAAGLVAALATRRAELVVVVTPFAARSRARPHAAGAARPRRVLARCRARARGAPGAGHVLDVSTERPIDRLEVTLALPGGRRGRGRPAARRAAHGLATTSASSS